MTSANKFYTFLAEAPDQDFERLQKIISMLSEVTKINDSTFLSAVQTLEVFVLPEEDEEEEDEIANLDVSKLVVSGTEVAPTSDPYDEDDHRPRVDDIGIEWRYCKVSAPFYTGFHWAYMGNLGCVKLEELHGLKFASEVEEEASADPMDENDHRDRAIANRLGRLKWHEDTKDWHEDRCNPTGCRTGSPLEGWARFNSEIIFAPTED